MTGVTMSMAIFLVMLALAVPVGAGLHCYAKYTERVDRVLHPDSDDYVPDERLR